MKKTLIWLAACTAAMLGPPWLSTMVPREHAMMVVVAAFFLANPLLAGGTGIFAGWEIKSRWWMPLAHAALFVCGAWLFLEMGEPAFFLYAAAYLTTGILTMLGTAIVRRKILKR